MQLRHFAPPGESALPDVCWDYPSVTFRATSLLAVRTVLSTHTLQMRLCGRDFSLWPQYYFYTSLKELFLFGLLCICYFYIL